MARKHRILRIGRPAPEPSHSYEEDSLTPAEAVAPESELRPDGSPPGPAVAQASDRSLVSSIAWNATADWITQIFSWLSFLVVMRLLSPADFGIAAIATLLLPYLVRITGFGIPRAIVNIRTLTDEQLAQLNTVSFLTGIALFLATLALAKPFAAFFGTPRAAPVIVVACSSLLLLGLQGVPNGVLARDMRFRLLSIFNGISAFSAASVTLVLALCGWGYWALVLGNLFSVVVRSILVLRAHPCKLAWPNLPSIRQPLSFGSHVVVSLLAMNSYQSLDNFTAGKTLGQAALGLYGAAWNLANVPLEKIVSLVTTVIPSYLAAVQDDPPALQRYLRGLTETIALLTFPATVGLGLVAREMVPLVFGHKWDGMIGPLQVLSFYAGFRSIVALLPKFLTAAGEVRYVMWNDLAALVALPVAFYIGSFYGTVGIAWGWVIAYPAVVIPLYVKTFRTIKMRVGEYLRALRPSLEATLVMIVAVEIVKHGSQFTHSLLLRLLIEILAGACAYICTLQLGHRERTKALLERLRGLLGTSFRQSRVQRAETDC